MKINVIDPSQDSRWDEFVENHPLGCIFHHSAWKEVIGNTFPQVIPFYLIAENAGGRIKGGIPLFLVKSWITGTRLVSLPFSLYCDPLVDSQDVFELLLQGVLSKRSELGASFVALRTRFADNLFKESNFKEFRGYKNHTLGLEADVETLKKTFDRTCVRQRINRAEKSNLTVIEASSEDDIRIFYELHCLTRKKYGVPPQPYGFFKNMWEILHSRDMFSVLIAKYDTEPVSALLFLKYKQRIHAEYMGTNDAFLKYSPNILLFWRAIQAAKEENYGFFDFGGSHISSQELITFKKRWGTVEEDIVHYYFPEVKGPSGDLESNIKHRILQSASKKMPELLFKWTGAFLYRHLGG